MQREISSEGRCKKQNEGFPNERAQPNEASQTLTTVWGRKERGEVEEDGGENRDAVQV